MRGHTALDVDGAAHGIDRASLLDLTGLRKALRRASRNFGIWSGG